MQLKQYNSISVLQSYDPTRTLSLRNAFANDMKRRFGELTKIIQKAVVDEDCFGLSQFKVVSSFQINQMQTPGQGAFAFSRSEVKLAQFMKWLQEQVDKGLIDVRDLQQVGTGIEGAWTNKYIFDSYKRGVIRARYELQKAGYKVPSIDDTGGIEVSMSTPFHLDRLGLLYTRVYSELQGITASMDSQISRILAQGIADGDNPRLLARKLVSTINGSGMGDLSITDSLGRFIPAERRAEMLARTEIIRGHHLATIQEYRNWAVEGVFVQAEWVTAGDKRVCTRCEALAKGSPYTLDQIEKMIPAHPCCRCCAIPMNVIIK
jgi:SPP1 gp7 family putative phage head morphogenesis protein